MSLETGAYVSANALADPAVRLLMPPFARQDRHALANPAMISQIPPP